MTSISKTDAKQRGEILKRLRDTAADVEKAVEEYNKALADLEAGVQSAVEKYNEAIQDAASFRDDLVSSMEDYISEKSERWQESDRGQNYNAWMRSWQECELSEVEITLPEAVEEPDLSAADQIEDLPDEPDFG